MFKFKDEVDLTEVLKNFTHTDNTYEMTHNDELFGEFIIVNKNTKEIFQHGYNGLLFDWLKQGYITYTEKGDI
jgi:hypothetical protein